MYPQILIQTTKIEEVIKRKNIKGKKAKLLKDLKYPQEKLQGLETTSLPSTFIVSRVKWGNKRITHWFPNSDATKRKPVLSTHMAAATGTVSKYLSRISVTWNGKRKILVRR